MATYILSHIKVSLCYSEGNNVTSHCSFVFRYISIRWSADRV